MSRRAPSSRNVLRIARFLTVVVAVTAVAVGTVAPVAVATASATQSTSANLARTSGDPTRTGTVKTYLTGFDPGNIMSDAVFTNKATMTEAQIQAFFNGKVSSCQSGYTCLKDFRINSVNRPADAYCSGYTGAANESAARIIYRVAQACNINPQVLIVMLQKEQGLVTHVWPSQWRYDMALGQGCPDTAPCDPNFVGFFHQIFGAARQMQIYMEGRWFQWYAPGNTWGILYHPNASCGRGNVYIANKATAALYYYTPYQPNAAALRAGFGEGDGCSSYGNRNFYNYFTEWFGPTQPVPKPVLTSMNESEFVLATSTDGVVRGYPYANNRWGDPVSLATGFAGVRAAYLVGDVDGDANRDIVLIGADRRASLLRGTGGMGFQPAIGISVDWSTSVMIAPAGDFDADGTPDMFTTNADGALLLWRGDNKSGFRAPIIVGSGWNSMNLMSGGQDFTGDGHPDLIGRDAQGRIRLFVANGRGGWGSTSQIGHGWQGMTAVFTPGDYNGDGTADLLARDSGGALWMYPGTGNASVRAGIKVGSGWHSMASVSGAGPTVTTRRALDPGAGDIDGDGKSDVLALGATGDLNLYKGTGSGGWLGSSVLSSGWGKGDRLVPLGDFDGDGERDAGRIDEQGRFYLHSSSSGLASGVQIGHGWGNLELTIGSVDFDGDRKTDVLARDSSGNLVLYRGTDNGGWGQSSIVGKGWGSMEVAFYAGDFDGDGLSDIVARRDDGTLWLYSVKATGGWGSSRQIGKGWQGMSTIFSPGDFDGDGNVDVISRTDDGALLLYRGNGRGGWLSSTQIGKGWGSMLQLG